VYWQNEKAIAILNARIIKTKYRRKILEKLDTIIHNSLNDKIRPI
jgi:hypothetical protein